MAATLSRHHYDFLMESAVNAMNASSVPSRDASEKVWGCVNLKFKKSFIWVVEKVALCQDKL